MLTDPKSRKVIIVEPPLIPIPTKELFARILFDNLQVGLRGFDQYFTYLYCEKGPLIVFYPKSPTFVTGSGTYIGISTGQWAFGVCRSSRV